MRPYLMIIICFLGFSAPTDNLSCQSDVDSLAFFEPSPVFHQKRFRIGLGFSVGTFGLFSYGLYNTWYKQYEQESFHFFNDYGEWENIDKYGHLYSSYFQAVLMYKGAKWTGMKEKNAIWTGLISAAIFQSTIEVMDGFSSKWGFSVTDMAANTVGLASFGLQQKYWGEQRILFKVSSWPKSYENMTIVSEDGLATSSLHERTDFLFGTSYAESFLKDYNAQTIWASANVHSFLPDGNKWPAWLNIAVGYSAENMFGGFENEWITDGSSYRLDSDFDRYKQFLIGADLDLSRLNPKNHFLKTLFSVFNIFKFPSPAIEINTRGEFHFHLLYLN